MKITNEENYISVEINDVTYKISLRIFPKDVHYCEEIENIENQSSKDKIRHFIYYKSFEENKLAIESVSDYLVDKYTYFLLDRNTYLKKHYESLELVDKYDRVWYCIQNPLGSLISSEIFTNISNSSMRSFLTTCENIRQSLNGVTVEFIATISKVVNSDWYKSMLETFQRFTETVSQYVFDLDIPEINQEEKERLIYSFKEWGKYGWTVCNFVPFEEYSNAPLNLKDADKRFRRYFSKNEMDMFFKNLESKSRRKKDIREAVNCYNNGYYKASSMILFSLIDSILIRKNLKDYKNEKKVNEKAKLHSGMPAIKAYEKKLNPSFKLTNLLFNLFKFISLFRAMKAYFDDTKDFTKKFDLVNRNYLDHGMTYKPVKKIECIKLFIIYDNLLTISKM